MTRMLDAETLSRGYPVVASLMREITDEKVLANKV